MFVPGCFVQAGSLGLDGLRQVKQTVDEARSFVSICGHSFGALGGCWLKKGGTRVPVWDNSDNTARNTPTQLRVPRVTNPMTAHY